MSAIQGKIAHQLASVSGYALRRSVRRTSVQTSRIRSFFSTKAEINKSDLIQILRQKENLTAEQAKSAVDGLLETITNAVAKGEKVSIVGFGSFEKTVRAPRIGRNPKTGEKIDIPEKATPTFKAGKAFKDVVAESHNK